MLHVIIIFAGNLTALLAIFQGLASFIFAILKKSLPRSLGHLRWMAF